MSFTVDSKCMSGYMTFPPALHSIARRMSQSVWLRSVSSWWTQCNRIQESLSEDQMQSKRGWRKEWKKDADSQMKDMMMMITFFPSSLHSSSRSTSKSNCCFGFRCKARYDNKPILFSSSVFKIHITFLEERTTENNLLLYLFFFSSSSDWMTRYILVFTLLPDALSSPWFFKQILLLQSFNFKPKRNER